MARPASSATLPFRHLLALARDLMQAPDLRSVLELVGPAVRELLTPEDALLLITLGDHEYATIFDARGLPLRADREGILYLNARQALAERRALLLPDLDVSPESAATKPPVQRAGSLLALPFPPVEPVGVIAVRWHRQESEQQIAEHASILRYISELTGAALGNVDFRLVLEEEVSALTAEAQGATRELRQHDETDKETERIAVRDVLTGMLNRRGFFLHAEQALKLARRQGVESNVIFADIDNLKDVNSELGHDVGDHLLQAAAQILRDSFRDSDVVARLGGDQFAAFTLDSAKPEAILTRIKKNTDQFHRRFSTPYQVSFSTGIVQCLPSSDLTVADYLAMADGQISGPAKTH